MGCDALVIGGGIAGCGIARDLAMRGIDTILIEKDDFGSGATSKSTRLVHGGLRYLQNLEFGLVHEGLSERETLLRIAPHLVKPLKFIMPVYEGSKPGRRMLGLGMTLYDALSYGKSVPSHAFLSRSETMDALPIISSRGLAGAFSYYDAKVEMVERLCLENAIDAESNGARIYNHSEVTGLGVRAKNIKSVIARLEGRSVIIEPKTVVNATGPWLDSFLERQTWMCGNFITPVKGIHLITDRITDTAAVFYSQEDGRLLFIVPFGGNSLIGTTDTYYPGNPDLVESDAKDIKYVLESMETFAPGAKISDYKTYAGLRPLVRQDSGTPSSISRKYRVIDHERQGIQNLISIAGTKITEYRSMAEKAGRIIAGKLGVGAESNTGERELPGGGTTVGCCGSSCGTVKQHLRGVYGSRSRLVEDMASGDSELSQRISQDSPDVMAQVYFSVKHEHAKSLQDFMLRRSQLYYSGNSGLDGAERVAAAMGKLLGWDKNRINYETSSYLRHIETHKSAVR